MKNLSPGERVSQFKAVVKSDVKYLQWGLLQSKESTLLTWWFLKPCIWFKALKLWHKFSHFVGI